MQVNRTNFRLAGEQADGGRITHAIKVLKEALKLQEQMEPLKAALDLQGQSDGPSAEEVTKAKALQEQLLKGNY